MSEMVERVARALCSEDGRDPEGDDCWNFGRDHSIKKKNWEAYVGGARAAILAMREPTDAVLKAGAAHWDDDWCSETNALNMWNGMIDEALK